MQSSELNFDFLSIVHFSGYLRPFSSHFNKLVWSRCHRFFFTCYISRAGWLLMVPPSRVFLDGSFPVCNHIVHFLQVLFQLHLYNLLGRSTSLCTHTFLSYATSMVLPSSYSREDFACRRAFYLMRLGAIVENTKSSNGSSLRAVR